MTEPPVELYELSLSYYLNLMLATLYITSSRPHVFLPYHAIAPANTHPSAESMEKLMGTVAVPLAHALKLLTKARVVKLAFSLSLAPCL